MKKLITITFSGTTCLFVLAFLIQSFTFSTTTTVVTGIVTDADNQALIGASVFVKGTSTGTATDINGRYKLTCPAQKKVVIVCSYTGYKTIEKTIETNNKSAVTLDFKLTEGLTLIEEVMVSGRSSLLKKRHKNAAKSRAPSRSEAMIKTPSSPPPPPVITYDASDRDETIPAEYEVVFSAETYEEVIVSRAIKMEKEADVDGKAASTSTQPALSAGVLTAGEIHDFSKWELWNDVATEDLNEHVKTWNFQLTERYVVQVLTNDGFPVVDAVVQLQEQGKNTWTARTDNTGKAELWANVFEASSKPLNELKATVNYQGKLHTIEQLQPFQESINFLRLDASCDVPDVMDIMFVVDATSSMKDELRYIQAEIYDVIQRVQDLRKEMTINLGSVFYRDEGDEYLTRKSDLSADISQTVNFIKKQSTAGGGDFPEAVEKGLSVAIDEMTWSESSLTKLLFLVLDAPPHETPDILKELERLTQKAATKGIRIIPIASSGINKSTEYLLRSLALSTNGTYTFLTDHSGVGNAHIEPSTDSYEVEKLNDLLIRLIKQFTQVVDCESSIDPNLLQNNNKPPAIQASNNDLFKCYPNPTSGIFTLEINEATKEVFVTDGTGKNLMRLKDVQAGKMEVDLSNFPSGTYYVRCLQDKKLLVEKVVLIGEGMVTARP